MMDEMKCKFCGAEMDRDVYYGELVANEDMFFCPHCGASALVTYDAEGASEIEWTGPNDNE